MTAFYCRALGNAARIARRTGDPARAEGYERLATEVSEAFNRELWVPEKGLYCDGHPGLSSRPPSVWRPADRDGLFFSVHANALAAAYGLAPVERRADILRRALRDESLPAVQPYFMHYVFDALESCGLYDELALGHVRRWRKLLDEHATSWKETWHTGDYSHAWSGTPTYQLSARVLGVAPAAPGFSTVRIRPHIGDLARARGKVPTPRGTVEVSWSRPTQAGLVLETSLPPDVRGIISLPKRDAANVTVSEGGRTVWSRRALVGKRAGILSGAEDERCATFEVSGKSYRFTLERE
jgi:hypothetical protein